jgi:hypothetical protein
MMTLIKYFIRTSPYFHFVMILKCHPIEVMKFNRYHLIYHVKESEELKVMFLMSMAWYMHY